MTAPRYTWGSHTIFHIPTTDATTTGSHLDSAKSARSGNLIASMGMLIAVVTTLVAGKSLSYELIVIGIIRLC